MNVLQYLPKTILFTGAGAFLYSLYSGFYLIAFVILVLLIIGLFFIGKKVTVFKKDMVKAAKSAKKNQETLKRGRKYSRKSTPKVPAIK